MANITSSERIDDGLPHRIVATRYDLVSLMKLTLFAICLSSLDSSLCDI